MNEYENFSTGHEDPLSDQHNLRELSETLRDLGRAADSPDSLVAKERVIREIERTLAEQNSGGIGGLDFLSMVQAWSPGRMFFVLFLLMNLVMLLFGLLIVG